MAADSEGVNILVNLANSLGPVYKMVTGAAYVMGIAFAFKALYALKVYGEARTMMSGNTSMKEPLTFLFIAGIFIYLPTGFAVVMNSTFGYANVLSYSEASSGATGAMGFLFGSGNAAFGNALMFIIQVIGVIAFVRGWIIIGRSAGQGQQPGGATKGLTHIIGGVLAMNIVGTMQVVTNTLFIGS